jgi:hypothetical protein
VYEKESVRKREGRREREREGEREEGNEIEVIIVENSKQTQ